MYKSNNYLSRSTITGGAENYITDATDFYYNVPYLYSTQLRSSDYDDPAFSIKTFNFWHDTTSDKVRHLFLLSPHEMGINTLQYDRKNYLLKNDSYLTNENNPIVSESSGGVSSRIYEYYYNTIVRKPIYIKGTSTPAKILTRTGAYTTHNIEPSSGYPMGGYSYEFISVDTSSYTEAETICSYLDSTTYIAPCFKII